MRFQERDASATINKHPIGIPAPGRGGGPGPSASAPKGGGGAGVTPAAKVAARFFEDRAALRRWFEEHHADRPELWIGYYRRGVDRPGVRYAEAVEEALCFGWIDGQVRSLDPDSYANRYTPRRSGSGWSAVNIAKATELLAAGRMHPAGARAFAARVPANYLFEAAAVPLDAGLERLFRRDRGAFAFFRRQPAGYRRTATSWVMAGKRPETRARRLERLRALSSERRRLDGYAPRSEGRRSPGGRASAPSRRRAGA